MIIHMSCSGWFFILTCWLNKVWHGWLSTCVLLRSKPFVVITFSSHPIGWMWWVHGQAREGSWIRSNKSGYLRTFSLFLCRLAFPLGCGALLGLLDHYLDAPYSTLHPLVLFSLFLLSYFISDFIFIFHIF